VTAPRPDAEVRGTIVDKHRDPAPHPLEEVSVAPLRMPDRPGSAQSRVAPAAIAEHLGPLLVLLRWSTVGVGVLLLATTRDLSDPGNLVAAAILTLYTAFRTLRPLQIRDANRAAEIAVFAELALCVVALSISGLWESPFVLVPIPSVMIAGFGWGYRQGVAAAAIAAGSLTLADVIAQDGGSGIADGAQAALMLGLCGCIGAFTRQLWISEEARRRKDLDQYARMATANDLLSALHEVVQTLPASLDLGEVVASTQRRFHEVFDYTSATLIVRDVTSGMWRVELAEGVRLGPALDEKQLPEAAALALSEPEPVVHADLMHEHLASFAPMARSMLAAPLIARNTVIGLVVIEHSGPDKYGPDDARLLGEMVGPLALAVDNATWFARLRTLGAEAERARIARDLHDRLAQSLAYVAFELERLAAAHDDDPDIEVLHEVVRGVVGELRETLYQLRADVTDSMELEQVSRNYLERFQDRTGIACTLTARVRGRRLPIQVEQELWRILQEALTNVERHADARRVWVTWTIGADHAWLEIRDDGRGFRPASASTERYGLVGMRERAAAIGARLSLDSEPGFGTRILVELEVTP
jgi:signal transduction histidine kinase